MGTSAKGCPVVGLNRVAVWGMLTSWSTRKAVVDTYRRILRPRHPSPAKSPITLQFGQYLLVVSHDSRSFVNNVYDRIL